MRDRRAERRCTTPLWVAPADMEPKQLVPLVGRTEALTTALDAVAAARDGHGRLVVVHGEAGIGKTRLCHELRAHLDRRGTQVLSGRAGPGDADVSYSALAETLRATRRVEPGLWAAAARWSEILAAVVPEVAGKASVATALVDRPVVFEKLLDVVEEAALARATLWLLEDLHWADLGTWAFVDHAARRVEEMSLALVVTARDEDAPVQVRQRLVELRREPGVVDVPLGRLGAADTRAMVRAIAPALPDDQVDGIARRSAGVPLLIEELLALPGRSPGAIPDIVRAAARSVVARLAPDDLAVLEVAAVLGPRFEADLLVRTATIDPSRARDQMAGGGLLVAASDPGGEPAADVLTFRHPLVWEAVYYDVPLPRRRQLHSAVARTLDAHGVQPERVARHHELADDPEAALEVLLAARQAAGGNASRRGSLARTALDLARRHPRSGDRVGELARLAIHDLFLAGRWSELEPLLHEQWEERQALPLEARAWLANVAVMGLLFLGEIERARSIADEEVAHVKMLRDSTGTGLLLAQAAFLAYFTGDFALARRRAERAVDVATRSGDAEATARARLVRILARRRLDRTRTESVADLRANAAFARSAGLGVGESNSLFVLAYMTLAHEDFAAAAEVATAAGTWYGPVSRVLHGLVKTLEGGAGEAEALLAGAGPEVRHGIPTLALAVDVAEAHLFLHRGELDHARHLLERPPSAPEAVTIPMLRSGHTAALGWLAWEEDRLDDAANAFALSLESTRSGRGYNVLDTGPLMLPLQADTLVRLRRPDELRAAIDRCATADPDPDRFTTAALAAARFRLEPSAETSNAAEEATRTAPWPWLQSLLGCWRGELLGDADAAATARDRFEATGALRGAERADAVLRRLGRRSASRHPSRARTGVAQLSPRELEVAELVAEGLTNSAIAARLFVSRATVSSHVAHILTKLGFTSRTQIAAWVTARLTSQSSISPTHSDASSLR